MKHLLTTFFISILITATSFADYVEDGITHALHDGDAKDLSRHFDADVHIALLSRKELIYSKSQAEVIMENFFKKNKVSDYRVFHKGKLPPPLDDHGARYFSGTLVTSTGTYRTYLVTKGEGDKAKINLLHFEVIEAPAPK